MIEDLNDNSSSSFDLANALNLPELKTSPDFSGGTFNDEVSTGLIILNSEFLNLHYTFYFLLDLFYFDKFLVVNKHWYTQF